MKRLLIYLLRWQLSIPILALVTWWLMDFGTTIGSIVANLIGGLIFYKIDKLIFSTFASSKRLIILSLRKKYKRLRRKSNCRFAWKSLF